MNALLRTLIICRSNFNLLLVIRFFLGDIPAGGTGTFVIFIPQGRFTFEVTVPLSPPGATFIMR